MLNGIRHVAWDWNGTLFDDVSVCVAALNDIMDRRGMPATSAEVYRETFGFPVKAFYENTLGFDFSVEDWDLMAREFHNIYGDFARGAELRSGVVDVLDRFTAIPVPMSVLSASEQALLDGFLETRGIRKFFTRTYGLSNLYAASKVDLGRRLVSDTALPPGEILLIGDTVHDHEVASELGFQCILVDGGHQARHRLSHCGRPVVSRLSDLADIVLG